MKTRIPKIRLAKIEHWRKFKENSRENITYSESRYDILIISLCSGGIFLDFNLYKFFIENEHCICDTFFLKLSIVAYSFSIFSNLFSQIASRISNKYILKYAQQKLQQYEFFKPFEEKGNKKRSDLYEKLNTWLNWISFILLFVGVLLFSIFAWPII